MEKEAMLYRGAAEDKVSRKTDSHMVKRQRNIVMIIVTLTILSFVPSILAACEGYDMFSPPLEGEKNRKTNRDLWVGMWFIRRLVS